MPKSLKHALSNIALSNMLAMITCLLTMGSDVSAQPVAVRSGETGQGFLFAHGSTCYAVLPSHVAKGAFRAQVIAEKGRSARASIRTPFWPGMDLALGILSRGGDLCEIRLDDLAGPRGSVAHKTSAVLVLVGTDGRVERLPMEITRIGYLDIMARFASGETATARQGMSGGFLLVDGVPVGMAIDTQGGETLRFMRVEEIHMNLSRLLSTQAVFGAAPEPHPVADAPAQSGLALRLLSATAIATGPDEMVENILLPDAAYVFEPKGPAVIELVLEDAAALAQLELLSKAASGQAVPRRVLIQVNASSEGGRWRTFWSGEMPPDGVLDTGARLATSARRLRITISSAWSPGPVRLDSVFAK